MTGLLFFVGTEDGIDGGAADGAFASEGGLTILHGDALGVLHFAFLFALHTVVLGHAISFLLT
jgi:hypothetical protein